MSEQIKVFKDKFVSYSSKDGEEGRVIEDFKGLNDAISGNLKHRLDVLLLGKQIKELIKDNDDTYASSERGKHEEKKCKGVKKETEHEICKCMYYYDRLNESSTEERIQCKNCFIKKPWTNIDKVYEVADYEYPMPYKHKLKKIKNVDLVLRDRTSGLLYAVEVKRPEGNNETISRMMAEILTYTAVLESAGEYGLKDGKKLLPAIAFFEGSKQCEKFKEYAESEDEDFKNLLKVIKVFMIKKFNRGNGFIEFKFECLS